MTMNEPMFWKNLGSFNEVDLDQPQLNTLPSGGDGGIPCRCKPVPLGNPAVHYTVDSPGFEKCGRCSAVTRRIVTWKMLKHIS